MSECDLDTPVPDWVIEHPETLAVFQELGIDYCCGGKSLGLPVANKGLMRKQSWRIASSSMRVGRTTAGNDRPST